MRFRMILLLLLFASVPMLHGQVQYDTVSVRSVGPGMTHYHIVAPAVPWNINVLRVDLTNPYVSLETVKATGRLAGRATVRAMAEGRSHQDHVVVGAVNGDFYDGVGAPITVQIAQGEFVRLPSTRPGIGFSETNRPVVGTVSFSGSVILPDTIATLHGVNTARGTDQLVLYNPYIGTGTGTNQYGTEVSVRPITPWIVNDTVMCVVEAIEAGVGNMSIDSGRAVLSGHGVSSSIVLSRLVVSDTLRIVQSIVPGVGRLTEMIGGYPKLVSQGGSNAFDAPREPRTAAGFSSDSSTLFLFAVDGRQGLLSVGMTFEELAAFMILSGVAEGINLDGGGSTTMLVRDQVVNSPSDGTERAVSNSLLVISSAPAGPLATAAINPRSVRVFRGQSVSFAAVGFDTLGNPADVTPGIARFACDASIGSIDSLTGTFSAGLSQAQGWVRLTYDGQHDSAFVFVKSVQTIALSPRSVVTDTVRDIQFRIRVTDIDGLDQSVPLTDFEWTISDPGVGTIMADGTFVGAGNGTAIVRVRLGSVRDSATVSVQLRTGSSVLDSLETVTQFYALGSNVTSSSVTTTDSLFTVGSRSARLDYSFVGSASNISYIYLYTNMLLYGVPDSVVIDGRSSDHQHRIYYLVEDDNGEEFRLYSSALLQPNGTWQVLRAPLLPNQAVVTGSDFQFPVRIKRIEVQLVYNRQAGVTYTGSLFLDNLRVVYPPGGVTVVDGGEDQVPGSYQLYQNYPNPFNPETAISFHLPSRAGVFLIVYDLIGREVRRLLDGEVIPAGRRVVTWDGRDDRGKIASSGVYLYVLRANGERKAGRMILLR